MRVCILGSSQTKACLSWFSPKIVRCLPLRAFRFSRFFFFHLVYSHWWKRANKTGSLSSLIPFPCLFICGLLLRSSRCPKGVVVRHNGSRLFCRRLPFPPLGVVTSLAWVTIAMVALSEGEGGSAQEYTAKLVTARKRLCRAFPFFLFRLQDACRRA